MMGFIYIFTTMKTAIQKVFNALGYKISKTESKPTPPPTRHIIPEIDDFDERTIRTALQYSMTSTERMWAIIQSLKMIARKHIPGDLVECGVWRGGNILLFALESEKLGLKRDIWAYDTYEGMSEPTDADVSFRGKSAQDLLAAEPKIPKKETHHNVWCYSPIDEVRANIARHAKSTDHIRFVKGKVEDTLKDEKNLPKEIALLRLDTDWYESTKMGLETLYPRLAKGGVLIMDDYGHWGGARRAADEYFKGEELFLHRVDYTCRLLIKE